MLCQQFCLSNLQSTIKHGGFSFMARGLFKVSRVYEEYIYIFHLDKINPFFPWKMVANKYPRAK